MSIARVITATVFAIALSILLYSRAPSPGPAPGCRNDARDVPGILNCATAASRAEKYEDAIGQFESVALGNTDATSEQRRNAVSGLLRGAGQLLRVRLSEFVLKYFLPLFVLAAAISCRFILRLFPRKGIEVSFSDLNAESGSASASSRSLTAELLFLLEDPEPLAIGGLKMNVMPGTGQPAFGVVRPAEGMTKATDFSSSKNPVKLGAVEFGVDDLARLFRRLFGRPSEGALEGWLSCGENSAVAAASLTRSGYRSSSGVAQHSWRATASGKNAREEALASIAAQVLVDTRDNRFTDSWESLKACQDGIKKMREQGGEFESATARRSFEIALEHDSANWIARFYLALSLCAEDDGKPAIALRHFAILDQILSRAESEQAFLDGAVVKLAEARRQRVRQFLLACRARIRARRWGRGRAKLRNQRTAGLMQHLVNFPECPFIVQYNIAICMQELQRISGDQEFQPYGDGCVVWSDPLESLADIAALQDPAEHSPRKYSGFATLLRERDRLELSLYAQSASAHIISTRLTAGSVGAIEKLLRDIDGTCCLAREQESCFDLRIDSWRAIETTRAVALSSLARALASEQPPSANREEALMKSQKARNLLYEAIASEPHLVSAYLVLGRLYTEWEDKFAINWADRAESLLTRAHEMNPKCRETIALLSKLHAKVGETQTSVTRIGKNLLSSGNHSPAMT